jgi:cytochrome c peroxidase
VTFDLRRVRGTWLLTALILSAAASANPWLPAPIEPSSNPSSPAKIALGRELFHATVLSATQRHSCATCHQPERHFTDGLKVAMGPAGQSHTRNTPTLYNVAYNASYGWEDSGVTSLEAQHRLSLTGDDPIEMGFDTRLLARLNPYRSRFEAAFGDTEISLDSVIHAIAAYVRTLRAPVSAWDRLLFFDEAAALGDDARRGMRLFFSDRLGCSGCHSGFNFSGPVRHRGAQHKPQFHQTGTSRSNHAFRAPSLRAIRHTGPYMHNGSIATLRGVVLHYERTEATQIPDFVLTEEERHELIAFLEAL